MLDSIYRKFVIAGIVIIISILLILLYLFYSKSVSIKVSGDQKKVRIITPDEQEIMNKPRPNINYMDGLDVIYWINLDRSPDRRKEMTRLFQNPAFQTVKVERISAVDGKKPHTVYPYIKYMYKQKNDYEYACMLSHLSTIHKFAQTTYDVALITEDDVTLEFKPYWRKSIQEVINNAPSDWEVIQLCYIINNARQNPVNFKLYEKNIGNKCVSAAAYLIRNNAAKKLINDIYNGEKYELEDYIIHHADCYIFNKLNTYIYKFPYFIYKTNNDSLLHPEDLKHHERSKLKVLQMYKDIVS